MHIIFKNFATRNNIDEVFVSGFSHFNDLGNKAFENEQRPGNDFYSAYAMKNFQEFWAESAELFFEKPDEMKAFYPDLYESMKNLLNQDPVNNVPV
ncbi:MAG: zinc-dependent peptidase [Ferruginibacter sp.]